MNSFQSGGENPVSFVIHKNSDINADTLQKKIKEKIPDTKKDDNISLVYIYYLLDKKFNFPKGE